MKLVVFFSADAQLEACCAELLALMALRTFVAGNRTAAL